MATVYCYNHTQIVPLETGTVSPIDLVVQRGYGIFDFLRVSQNKPLFIDDHLDRFFRSAEIMHLSIPETRAQVKAILFELIEKNNLPSSGCRLLIAGGPAPDGYTIQAPHLLIIQQPLVAPSKELNKKGLYLRSYQHQRQLSEVKTTDYLMAIWLQPWLKSHEADDLLYHYYGMVSECPRSNIFMVTKENLLVTPDANMLKGVTRKQILSLAAENNIRFEERPIKMHEFFQAKEAFITSSTKRITPIRQIDEHCFEPLAPQSLTERIFQLLVEKEENYLNAF